MPDRPVSIDIRHPLMLEANDLGLLRAGPVVVGPGENLPVTEAELEYAFTRERLNDLAIQAGTATEALPEVTARELPGARRPGDPASHRMKLLSRSRAAFPIMPGFRTECPGLSVSLANRTCLVDARGVEAHQSSYGDLP